MIPTDSTQRLAPDPRPQPRPDTTTPIESQRMPPPQSRAASGRREKSLYVSSTVHLPFGPRGSTVSGQHSNFRYPFLNLVFFWSNPTSEPESVARIPLPVSVSYSARASRVARSLQSALATIKATFFHVTSRR